MMDQPDRSASPIHGSCGLPRTQAGEPVFAEPWQAQAFALTVALRKRVFTWHEWANALAEEIRRPGRAADGHDYYESWLDALCRLLAERDVASGDTLRALAQSWQRAARATPHGMPILRENDPVFRP